MFGKTKSLFLIVASMLCMASCDSIREDLPRCELWLEFVFDYNMEYADAFNPQVKSVDVLVFDSDDKLLFTKSVKVAALVGFSGWNLFGSVANVGVQQGGNILLNIFYGVTVNAAVGVANQASMAIYGFVSNFQIAFNPSIIKSYAIGDRD